VWEARFVRIELGAGKLLDQGPEPSRMVQMDVGHEDVPNLPGFDPRLSQTPKEPRSAGGGTDLHQGPTFLFREEITGDDPIRIPKPQVHQETTLGKGLNGRHGRVAQSHRPIGV
jgi:hypothetical protein